MKTLNIIALLNWGVGLEILNALHNLPQIQIHAVITDFDRTSHDPWKNTVYEFARQKGYATYHTMHYSQERLVATIQHAPIDLMISHAYMHILPPTVFLAPRLGTLNIHPSLLPNYRGPAPTYWVLHNKEKYTGLTSHFMDEGIDTGDMVYQIKIPLHPDDTTNEVLERMKQVAGKLVSQSIKCILDQHFKPVVQQSREATYAPRPQPMEVAHEAI